MVHKGEGGQICPKIGPPGLRMILTYLAKILIAWDMPQNTVAK